MGKYLQKSVTRDLPDNTITFGRTETDSSPRAIGMRLKIAGKRLVDDRGRHRYDVGSRV